MKWNLSHKKNPQTSPFRIYFLLGIVLMMAVAIVGRLYYYQVVQGSEYRAYAKDQYISRSHAFRRGTIYFTQKNGDRFGAAVMSYGYFLFINPRVLEHPEEVYNTLSKFLEIDRAEFLDSAKKTDDIYEEIADQISENTAMKIRQLNIPGLRLHKDSWRSYPGRTLASQVIGYYGYYQGGRTGVYGLEEYYNDILTPSESTRITDIFAKLFGVIGTDELVKKESHDRFGDIYTTIEPTVQRIFEKNLAQAKERWGSPEVGGIIMNPKTGAIYAMASLPGFDPNRYSKSEISTFNNPLIGSMFEMGSIIKALTMASALDAEAVTLDTQYYDRGTRMISGLSISNYDFVARGWTGMQNILNHSLNLGAVFLMEEMGQEKFADYFRKFGLNKKTGIDLPGEITSELRLKDRHEVGYATAAFGQGIALTPIATIRALSALGNGGTLPEPHVLRKIEYKNGEVWKWTPPKDPVRVISPETSDTISRMLTIVMDDYMLGGTVDLKHYSIAAKTGTAQVTKPGGGYYENRYFHSYFGYYPATDPKFIVFLYMKYPKDILYASHTLTQPFMDTAKFLLNYYEVPPDR